MADKYFRLVCFVVNICPQPLREFFIKLAKCDAGTSYSNIDAYLSQRHRDIIELKRRRKIRDDQFNLLYPGHGTCDVNKWDVTLLITLITEMFPASLNPMEKFCIDEIRTIRNQLQHLSNTSSMSDKDFDIYWGRLDNASMTLAKQTFSVTSEAGFRKTIDSANTSHLPDLGDALRLWYEETIREMADTMNKMNDTINDMKHKLDKIESDTTENTSILRQVTVEKSGHAGDKQKRFKAEDNILVQLQADFETTVMELPDSFSAPLEVADIRTKLRDNHYVVATGNYNSCYFETALAAIKGMDYNIKRSVEMHTSSDWRHIDPNDVDFVLCRHPFGIFAYDENKAKGMADIFNSMMHTTKGDEKKTLDIVIVTDLTILTECKKYYDHDILEEIVKVFDDTSESRPTDLTLGCRNQNVTSHCFPVANNLGVLTSNFLKHYSISSSQVNESEIKEAKDTFKAKKVIVLTGPGKCGKTSVAVALASSYQPSQCSLLTEPRDFKKIDLQNICLIIIDEFAGQYCYDGKNVYKWYSMFDHLYNAITRGQMNVIITCERSKLDKCCSEIFQHPLLQHRVIMPERTTAIKQEMALQHTELVTDPLSQIHGHQSNQSGTQIKSAGNSTGFLQWSATSKDTKQIKYVGDRANCNIVGCCQLPSGDVLLVDQPNMRLKRLDFRYNVISVCDLYDCPWDVCCISNDTAAIAVFQKLQFVDVREQTLVITRTVDTDHDCKGLTCHGNKMYVLSTDSIYVHNIYGRKQLTLYTHTSDINQIVVSGDGSKIYIASNREGLVTIDSSGNRLYTFSDPDLLGVCGVCVDDKGNVLACGCWSNDVLMISSDGKQKLGIITEQTSNDIQYTNALSFSKKQFTILTTGYSNNICVLTLGSSV